MKKRKYKKGSFQDVALFIIILFGFGLVAIVGTFYYRTVTSNLSAEQVFIDSPRSIEAFDDVQTQGIERLDYFIFMVVVGMLIALIITGWLVAAEPLFAIIYIIALIVINIVAIILSYVWQRLTEHAIFYDQIIFYPITNFMLNNLIIFSISAGFLGIISIYLKKYFDRM